jgi:hypothetical protein
MHPLMQQVPPARRTTVQVQLWQDPWPLITGWAAHHKYEAAGPPFEGMMVYQRGWGANKPHLVVFHIDGNLLTIQACIRFSGLERLRSLFILPAEINIGAGGRGVLARRKVRGEVNELLGHLGAPPIQ